MNSSSELLCSRRFSLMRRPERVRKRECFWQISVQDEEIRQHARFDGSCIEKPRLGGGEPHTNKKGQSPHAKIEIPRLLIGIPEANSVRLRETEHARNVGKLTYLPARRCQESLRRLALHSVPYSVTSYNFVKIGSMVKIAADRAEANSCVSVHDNWQASPWPPK